MNQRERVLEQVAQAVVRRAGSRATIVAVDGADAAGKSSFARDLRAYLGRLGRAAICVSLDGFHKPRAARYVAADAPVTGRVVRIDPCSIVLFDGVFLLRPELQSFCDFTIYLHIRPATSLARGVARDAAAMGGEANARKRYLARYLPAQQRYLVIANAAGRADIVIDNEDFAAPRLIEMSFTARS